MNYKINLKGFMFFMIKQKDKKKSYYPVLPSITILWSIAQPEKPGISQVWKTGRSILCQPWAEHVSFFYEEIHCNWTWIIYKNPQKILNIR